MLQDYEFAVLRNEKRLIVFFLEFGLVAFLTFPKFVKIINFIEKKLRSPALTLTEIGAWPI